MAYPLTHDLNVLLGLLEDEGEAVSPSWPLVRLNVFAVRFRYEALGGGAPLGDRAGVLSDVGALVEHVRTLLGA